jgi:amidase
MDVHAIVGLLRSGEIRPHDLLETLEQRISKVDGAVNALPTLCFERAYAQADALMKRPAAERGQVAGMPIPIKDLSDVAGVRTTLGSLAFADNVPKTSNLFVRNLEEQGGIVYAKSNTPELGAGSNTFNDVFGPTLNPWNTLCSAGGSSGGAAAALATGMAWLAQGSDMGGSLRNPASFCGVVGLRPSIGRVAKTPGSQMDGTLSVEGPMARNVDDVALLLDAMTGQFAEDPLSMPSPTRSFAAATRSGWRPRKVAYSADLGITPVDPEVASITRRAAMRLAAEGIPVEEAHPDLGEAHESFQVLRAFGFATGRGTLLETHRDLLKPEVIWNIEKGLSLTVSQIARAQAQRVVLMQRMQAFLEDYDLLLCPAAICAPFPIGERYLAECAGVKFETYIDWMAIAYAVTMTCCPALSLPCGYTAKSLPVGLQVVAPVHGEARLLAGAKLLEGLFGLRSATPIDPRPAA